MAEVISMMTSLGNMPTSVALSTVMPHRKYESVNTYTWCILQLQDYKTFLAKYCFNEI